MRFKLGGYTESDGNGLKIPLSGMLVGTFSHTAKDLDPADSASNNKRPLQEISAFLAGRWTESLGSFIQVTTSDEAHGRMSLDNADIGFARPVQIAGSDSILGVSLNNNPTLSDPFNTLPGRRFPFTASELVGPIASPLLDGGLEQQVAGLSVYGLWNDSIYAELGAYRSLIAWKWMYFSPGTHKPDPSKRDGWNRGAYLIQEAGHCGECHTPRNSLGGSEQGMTLAGTKEGPEGAAMPNITPDRKTGIGSWS